jgi:hypothetical protein
MRARLRQEADCIAVYAVTFLVWGAILMTIAAKL